MMNARKVIMHFLPFIIHRSSFIISHKHFPNRLRQHPETHRLGEMFGKPRIQAFAFVVIHAKPAQGDALYFRGGGAGKKLLHDVQPAAIAMADATQSAVTIL
jgi:hypothetical protein